MSVRPLVQFKAGRCEINNPRKPTKATPLPTPGYIWVHKEEDLTHFCWRPRYLTIEDAAVDDELCQDLITFPGDARLEPWNHGEHTGVVNGRIYRFTFESSSEQHFYWLQSASQHPDGKEDHWSDKDLSLGRIVNEILNGEEDVDAETLYSAAGGRGGEGQDEDAEMHDAEDGPGSGDTGAGATGGDAMEDGAESRRGGEDGGRAGSTRPATTSQPAQDAASAAVANLLKSLQGNPALSGQGQQQSAQGKLFTTLPDLLPPSSTIPVVQSADNETLNGLLSFLPSQLLLLAQEGDDIGSADPSPETAQAAIQALTTDQKRDIINKVLRSPQFTQSLGSLTTALRDGGLPTISEALRIKVENGGFIRHGSVPLGGGEAVEAFLQGVKSTAQEEQKEDQGKSDTRMDTD